MIIFLLLLFFLFSEVEESQEKFDRKRHHNGDYDRISYNGRDELVYEAAYCWTEQNIGNDYQNYVVINQGSVSAWMPFEDQIKEVEECCARYQWIGEDSRFIFLVVENVHQHENFKLPEWVSWEIANGTTNGKNTEYAILIRGQRKHRIMLTG